MRGDRKVGKDDDAVGQIEVHGIFLNLQIPPGGFKAREKGGKKTNTERCRQN